MNIFLSQSGDRSHRVALLFSEWLPQVLQFAKPWVSSKDIDAGSIWDNEIQASLSGTNTGLVFLTQENKEKPWILYESGALSKGLTLSRVFTFLIDLKPIDLLNNPLSKFNHTINTRDKIFKLVNDINKCNGEERLADDILKKVFEKNYPELDEGIKDIITSTIDTKVTEPSTHDLLLEVLQSVRAVEKKVTTVAFDTSELIHLVEYDIPTKNFTLKFKGAERRDAGKDYNALRDAFVKEYGREPENGDLMEYLSSKVDILYDGYLNALKKISKENK